MTTSIEKPQIVKGTLVGLGLLAFFSIVACTSIREQVPEQAIATALRAMAANIAFVGVLSGTKLGRRAAIVVLALIAAGAVFGLVLSIQNFAVSPALSISLLALSIALVLWFAAYTFGKSARLYYSTRWTGTNESRSA